uniref:Nuclear receptor n=1 Tax=Pristionchus pacificus TaxID=54126 RepID=A0A2A6BQM2_PRIPA|eukprot:PDM68061.1 nuclear receptor [Pristionchus pacificus]
MEQDGKRLCLVCGGQSDSAHFGIDSCRACAAFFRRTVKLKKRYVCTQTTANCEIKKDNTWNCRSCRFNKCLAVGLLPENVHWKTNSSSVDDGDCAGPSSAKIPRKNSTPSSSESEIYATAISSLRPSVIANGFTNGMKMSLLMRIEEQYRQICVMRESSERMQMRARIGARWKVENENRKMQNNDLPMSRRKCDEYENHPLRATWGSLNQRTNMMIKCISEFALGSFDCFGQLKPEERWTLIQHYLTAIFVFEGSFRTKQLFPGNKDVFMMTYITYVDLNDMESYFADADTVTDKQKAARLLRNNIKHCMVDRMSTLMERADLTHIERMAIMALLMFPTYLMKGTPAIAQCAYDIQQAIHRELNIFYRLKFAATGRYVNTLRQHLRDPVGIQYKVMEDMEIYQLLNIFNKKSSVYTVLKQDYVAPSRIHPH